MILQKILLVSVVFLHPSIIRMSAGQSICTSGEIYRDDVASGCTCRELSPHGTCPNHCPVGQTTCAVLDSGIYLADCNSDCTSTTNKDCDACGIWLHSLCECEQNPSLCDWQHGKGVQGWVKLAGNNLATPNQPITNILALQNHQILATTGWDFGQQVSVLSAQGLAINPVRTISQDQVHMHICNFDPAMRDFLTAMSTASISTYKTLQKISLSGTPFIQGNPNAMWCLASQSKNTPINGALVYDAINSVLHMPGICNYNVATAVMRDKNGFTWGCVTADYGDTEHRFLSQC